MARKKILRPVNESKAFELIDGRKINSLFELATFLDDMDDHTFYHHVTYGKNDFAAWIYEAFNSEELSQKIGPIKNRRDMNYEIMKFIINNI